MHDTDASVQRKSLGFAVDFLHVLDDGFEVLLEDLWATLTQTKLNNVSSIVLIVLDLEDLSADQSRSLCGVLIGIWLKEKLSDLSVLLVIIIEVKS